MPMKWGTVSGFLCLLMVLGCSWNVAPVHAATVDAVYGTTPTIDGTIAAGEWADANFTTFTGPDVICDILVKQNGSHLHIGLVIHGPGAGEFGWLEIFFDTAHDTTYINDDDYFFQLTYIASIFEWSENKGLFNTWITQPSCTGWTGAASATPTEWQVELSISYAKFGVTPGADKTIGFAMRFHRGSSSEYNEWPDTLVPNNPSTWNDITSTGDLWVPWFTSLPMALLASGLLFLVLKRRSCSL